MTEAFIEKLKSWARLKTCYEISPDYSHAEGGNYDDAYSEGTDDGRTELAREILEEMGIGYDV